MFFLFFFTLREEHQPDQNMSALLLSFSCAIRGIFSIYSFRGRRVVGGGVVDKGQFHTAESEERERYHTSCMTQREQKRDCILFVKSRCIVFFFLGYLLLDII